MTERRSGDERRTGEDRRDDGTPFGASATTEAEVAAGVIAEERRSGVERRVDSDRRTGDAVSADSLSLGRRLRQRRTIISLVLPLILLFLIFRVALNVDVNELLDGIGRSNKLLILAGFLVFYAGFPLRGYRWVLLLRGTGFRLRTRDATEIIFLSWLVNCLVPAKLGDLYRAYLLKINSSASLSRTVGTVFIERILDLFAIATLGLAAGFWSFRDGLPAEIQVVAAIGVGVMVLLALGLLTLRNFGRRILVRLPLPDQALELYDRFEEGVFGAVGLRALPGLVIITGFIWATEALRLYFVVQALNFPGVQLGLSGAVFVALIGSLLTAVPLAPAGLGVVELGVAGVLVGAYHVSLSQATTIVLVDRTISVFSIIVLGSIAYWFSPKRRGLGIQPHEPAEVRGSA
jgi:glycosyltransferase 2 family protein